MYTVTVAAGLADFTKVIRGDDEPFFAIYLVAIIKIN